MVWDDAQSKDRRLQQMCIPAFGSSIAALYLVHPFGGWTIETHESYHEGGGHSFDVSYVRDPIASPLKAPLWYPLLVASHVV